MGIYVNSSINYVRKFELEIINTHVIILDILGNTNLRIINIYRSFNPANNYSPRELFKIQLNLIRRAYTENCIVLGDFNLDWGKKGLNSYQFKGYFDDMEDSWSELNLTQMVNFPTWSRFVNNVERSSTIDHIYCTNPLTLENLNSTKPVFGDHLVIKGEIRFCKVPETTYLKRSWVKYSKEELCKRLSSMDWNITDDTVQG